MNYIIEQYLSLKLFVSILRQHFYSHFDSFYPEAFRIRSCASFRIIVLIKNDNFSSFVVGDAIKTTRSLIRLFPAFSRLGSFQIVKSAVKTTRKDIRTGFFLTLHRHGKKSKKNPQLWLAKKSFLSIEQSIRHKTTFFFTNENIHTHTHTQTVFMRTRNWVRH